MPAPLSERRRTVSRDEVIEAARAVLDEDGLDGLTMATVAGRVGFTTMALYRHVKNRDDLVAGAVASVLAEIGPGDPEGDWLEGVERWMHDVRGCLLAHRWAATQLGTKEGGSSPAWSACLEILVGHVGRSTLTPRAKARALAWTTRVTIGMLVLEIGAPRRRGRGRKTGPVAGELATLSDDDLWADAVAQTRSFLTALGES